MTFSDLSTEFWILIQFYWILNFYAISCGILRKNTSIENNYVSNCFSIRRENEINIPQPIHKVVRICVFRPQTSLSANNWIQVPEKPSAKVVTLNQNNSIKPSIYCQKHCMIIASSAIYKRFIPYLSGWRWKWSISIH